MINTNENSDITELAKQIHTLIIKSKDQLKIGEIELLKALINKWRNEH